MARRFLNMLSSGIVGLRFFEMTALYKTIGTMPVAIVEPRMPPIDKKAETLALLASINIATNINAPSVGMAGTIYRTKRLGFLS